MYGVDTDAFKIKAQETENRWNLSKGRFVLGVGGGTTKNNTLTAQAVEKLHICHISLHLI